MSRSDCGRDVRCARTVDPGSRARQVSVEQFQNGAAFLGREVDGSVYSHCVPVKVW